MYSCLLHNAIEVQITVFVLVKVKCAELVYIDYYIGSEAQEVQSSSTIKRIANHNYCLYFVQANADHEASGKVKT